MVQTTKTITTWKGRNILFRPPTWEDLDALWQYANNLVAEDTFVDLNKELTEDEEITYLQEALKKVRKKKAVYIYAFDQDKLIGGCNVEKGQRRSKHVGSFGISVDQNYRGEGVGRKLAEFTLELAKVTLEIDLATLFVYANNQVAIKLYQSLGFWQYGELPNGIEYKDKRVNKLLMYKVMSDITGG